MVRFERFASCIRPREDDEADHRFELEEAMPGGQARKLVGPDQDVQLRVAISSRFCLKAFTQSSMVVPG
jgi:hypothetical protein